MKVAKLKQFISTLASAVARLTGKQKLQRQEISLPPIIFFTKWK